jgi:hypothetical protein
MSHQELASAAMKGEGIKVEQHLLQRKAGIPKWSHQEKARDLDIAGADQSPDQ